MCRLQFGPISLPAFIQFLSKALVENEQKPSLAYVVWLLWNARNDRIFNHTVANPFHVIHRALLFANDTSFLFYR